MNSNLSVIPGATFRNPLCATLHNGIECCYAVYAVKLAGGGKITSGEQKRTEDEVFGQELSLDELDAAAGGNVVMDFLGGGEFDADRSNCPDHDRRQIYGGDGLPNCAATVEDGSPCSSNDECHGAAVVYKGLTECGKAWR